MKTHQSIKFILIIMVIVSGVFLLYFRVNAATYIFEQADWTGGLDGGINASHPTDESGWTKYSAKDALTTVSLSGISEGSTTGSITQTSDTDFNAGTFASTTVVGSGTAGNVSIASVSGVATNTWATLASVPVAINGNGMAFVSTSTLYTTDGGSRFYSYNVDTNTWSTNFGVGLIPSTSGSTENMVAANGNIYTVSFEPSGNNMARYTPGAGWTILTKILNSGNLNGAIVYPGSGDYIYINPGNSSNSLYRYFISVNAVGNPLASFPTTPYYAVSGAYANGYIYFSFRGNSANFLYRYSISGDNWVAMAAPPATIGPGGALVYPSSGDFMYLLTGNSTNLFYRYSISGNNWTAMTSFPTTVSHGGALAYPGSGAYIYGETTSGLFAKYAFRIPYYYMASFTSSAIDLGQNSSPTTFGFTIATSSATSIKFQIRSATTLAGLSSATWYGPTSTSDYYTLTGQTINPIHTGARYFQYQAIMTTSDSTQTPILNDVTINYIYYPASSSLTSSIYNSGDSNNILANIKWTSTVNSSSTIKFQIRSAPDSAGSPGTWTNFIGPDGTTGTYFASSTGGDTMPTALISNSQWFQYKAYVTTTDGSAPPTTLSDVQVKYTVNAKPEFDINYPTNNAGGVTATESATGTVFISYSILDSDTNTGSINPGFVTPTFQYSLNGGTAWNDIATSSLTSIDFTNKAVDTSTYNTYTASWRAASQIPGNYSTNTLIRVKINDNEAANNIASSTSAVFILDTKIPVVGTYPVLIDASQSPALVTFSVTDDTALQVKIGKVSNLSGSVFVPYTSTTTFNYSSGDVLYVQFMDEYGNATAIVNDAPPAAPTNIFYQDTSDVSNSIWREFFAWGVADVPANGFAHYNVYRSLNNGPYIFLTSITDRQINFNVDSGLSSSDQYSYRLNTQDSAGSISLYSNTTSNDSPDGVGSSNIAAPTLTSVAESNETTTGTTVTWTTNVLSNSTVYYVATTTWPGNDKSLYSGSVGVPSVLLSHSVTLSSLNPGTQYYYLVESQDSNNNTGQSANSAYTFTTNQGAILSNVSASTVSNNKVTVTWNSDMAADSVVVYSSHSDLSSPTTVSGSGTLTKNHSVTISGLTQGATYYYYVKSTDGNSNVSVNKNVLNGAITYFTFNTTDDTQAPIISEVNASLIGSYGVTIQWLTDKVASSRVTYDTDSAFGSATTTSEDMTYTTQHAVVLNNLSSSTQYFYTVYSRDTNGNSTTSPSDSTSYTFTTDLPRVTGTTTIINVTGGGGGGGSVDNRDLTIPVISNIKVTQISNTAVSITFNTSKITNDLVNYGLDTSYGSNGGDVNVYEKNHSSSLVSLSPLGTYHFSITVSDIYDNSITTTDDSFTLINMADPNADTNLYSSSTPINSTPQNGVVLTQQEQDLVNQLKSVSPNVLTQIFTALSDNSNILPDQLASAIDSFAKKAVAAPVILGAQISSIPSSNSVEIKWTTDKNSNSLVSYAESSSYDVGSDNPYQISAGNPNDNTTDHDIIIPNLSPATLYHFQVRSQASVGQPIVSLDHTFKTISSLPQISNMSFQDISENSADISWNTDVPTKTKIVIKNTATGVTITDTEKTFLTDHKYSFSNLDLSSPYTITLIAQNSSTTNSVPLVVPFNTILSSDAPKISNVRINTSLISGNVETAQTIVSWKTDKPASSKIYFTQGTDTSVSQSTATDSSLTQNHVVITTLLKPGTVYKIKAESGDSSGNITDSNPYTILTPAPAGSIIDVILTNLQGTFGVFAK